MGAEAAKSLVIGYGSIGKRHESVLRDMGYRTAVLSRHAGELHCPSFRDLGDAMDSFAPEYVVIANRTSEHLASLRALEDGGFAGTCLVEKPLFERVHPFEEPTAIDVWVGYVLRFHPLLRRAQELLAGKRLLSIDSYVGQYLPDWRPGTDYRKSYSASIGGGGGVIRDLSHELDYIASLAGPWTRVAALGGHFSTLEIETDDAFGLLFESERCPMILCQMNYLDRSVRRDLTVQYEGGTVHVDFVSQRIEHNGVPESLQVERDESFRAMHAAILGGDAHGACSFSEAQDTLDLIEAAEKASKEGVWVCRPAR